MKGLEYVLLALALVLAVCIGGLAFSTNSVSEKVVVQEKIVTVNVPVADNTTKDIRNKLFENDDFEAVALALATADLEAKGYKDLFNAMQDEGKSIDVKEDISKVFVKDSDVSSIDVDEQDAEVELELKVYFEDLSGDDVKIYVTVDYSIVDGEVEDVVYTF